MNDEIEHNKISWKRILVFFIIATAISNIFRFDIFELKSQLEQLPTWIFILTTAFLEGSGVIIGALIAISLLKKKQKNRDDAFGNIKIKKPCNGNHSNHHFNSIWSKK